MRNFWWEVRWVWLRYILIWSLLLGLGMSSLITLSTIVIQGGIAWDLLFWKAVWEIGAFWFMIAWSLAFLLSIIGAFKALFHHTYKHYKLELLDCDQHPYEPVIIRDIMPIWRMFLFFTVWLVVLIVLISVGVFGLMLADFGTWRLFAIVLVLGMMLLKPILSLTRNVRIVSKGVQ